MDIKTRLEDDRVLFLNSNSEIALVNMLKSLHNMGIYTVAELINHKESEFPQSTRKKYVAIANVFRHAYLGLDLVFDVLFEKKYEKNDVGFNECASDLLKLGFDKKNVCVESYLQDYKESQFSMEYILKNCPYINIKGPGLRNYYIKYIDEKKNKKEFHDKNMPSVLRELQKQLIFLINKRDSLDMQIQNIQNQIKNLGGDQDNYGK